MLIFTTALILAAISAKNSDDMRSTTASTGSGNDIAYLRDVQHPGWAKVRDAFEIHLKPSMTKDGPRLYMKHSNETKEFGGYMKTERFNAENPVWYMTNEERAMHELTFDNNGFVNSNGSFLEKKGEEERIQMRGYTGALIFVQGVDKTLYAAKKIPHYVQHSSFFSGNVVRNAGLMYLVNGKLSAIAWQSGHYIRVKNSSRKYAIRMVKHLKHAFKMSPDSYFVSDRYVETKLVEKFKMIRASEFLKDFSDPASYNCADFFDPANVKDLKAAIRM